MPTPRHKISVLVSDANGMVPVYHAPIKPSTPRRRCENPKCRCILAADNHQPLCSPCQRRIGGDPDLINVYDHVKPRRRQP